MAVKRRKPARRPDGRPGPPPGYPKDPAKYADPANWKYPVHSPFHARAARRYFNDPRNRAKYSPEEQAYVGAKIDAALKRFGVAVKITGGVVEREAGIIEEDIPGPKQIAGMSRDELLKVFLGSRRLKSARGIDYRLVTFSENRGGRIEARVKQYRVSLDASRRTLLHDCADWRGNRAKARLFCKHVGRLFLNLTEEQATPVLRQLLLERDAWEFR